MSPHIMPEDLKAELQTRLNSQRKRIGELASEADKLRKLIEFEIKRFEATKGFYELEFGPFVEAGIQVQAPLIEVPQRFADKSIREACREVLSAKGALHVKALHDELVKGGKAVKRATVTGILIRAKEFERVNGKKNTFKLKQSA